MSDFKVGFGRVNITPDFPAPLDSFGNPLLRIHDRVLSEIYYTAVAITDENDKTLLLTTYDITQCRVDIREEIAKRLQDECGIDPDYFHLSGTHTHSSIAVYVDLPEVKAYRESLIEKGVMACKAAMSDQKPAEIYVGETKVEGLNFVRHYMREDGTITGDNYGYISKAKSFKHMTEADNSLRIIKFVRTQDDNSEAKDIVLVNWQAHNHLTGGQKKTDLSADYSGAIRSWLESEHNCFVAFFQGCAGNLNEKSRITRENRTTNYLEYGRLISEYINEIYDNEKLKKIPSGKVVSIKETIKAKVNRDGLDRLADAQMIKDYRTKHGTTPELKQMAVDMGFHSPAHAAGIVARSKIEEDYIEIPLRVYKAGDVAFSAAPFEMFGKTGKEIREASPFPFTFSQGYTDANYYYLPTDESFEYGCYEVDTTRYVRGTAEQVRDKIIEMLNKLKDM
ncbi:MAG: hypothetical protein IJJ40_03750 [Clostridia bacterium]|nr:hypothetical protein [Clostridia bacterium]